MKKLNQSKKVLYCGMADDILSPLLLVPDLTHLYVICLLDKAFAKNFKWEDSKKDIKEMLKKGDDENSWHLEIYRENHPEWPITKLDEPCTLLEETESNNRWFLAFKYKGVRRELIYYLNKDYHEESWPSEIRDIEHLMSMGAVFMNDKYTHELMDNKKVIDTIRERTTKDCLYYEGHNHFEKDRNTYDYKKDYIVKHVRENDIIISKLEYELNRQNMEQTQKRIAPTDYDLLHMTNDEKLKRTDFFLEAESGTFHLLWKEHFYNDKSKDKLNWIQDMSGFGRTIGHVNNSKKMPVTISFSFYIIGEKYICFYYPTSRFVDWDLINDYLDKNFPVFYDNGRKAKTDALNFHHCLNFCKD